ncbi:MAG: hypothetical protein ACE5GM_02565 [bacterium]
MTGLQDFLVVLIVAWAVFSASKYLYYRFYRNIPSQSTCCEENSDCASCDSFS